METKEFKNFGFFAVFKLNNEEMMAVKGGDIGEPVPIPPPPPIRY